MDTVGYRKRGGQQFLRPTVSKGPQVLFKKVWFRKWFSLSRHEASVNALKTSGTPSSRHCDCWGPPQAPLRSPHNHPVTALGTLGLPQTVTKIVQFCRPGPEDPDRKAHRPPSGSVTSMVPRARLAKLSDKSSRDYLERHSVQDQRIPT